MIKPKYTKMLSLMRIHCQNCAMQVNTDGTLLFNTDGELMAAAEAIHTNGVLENKKLCATSALVIFYTACFVATASIKPTSSIVRPGN